MSLNSVNNTFKNFISTSGTITPMTAPKADIAAVRVGDVSLEKDTVQIKEEKTNKNHRKKMLGLLAFSIGSALLLITIGVFTLSKGFSGNIARRLSKISDRAKKAIYELNTQSQNLTDKQKMKLRLHKGVQHVADALQATSNISAVKDSAMLQLMKKLHMEPVANAINKFFRNKLVPKTKNAAYNQAEIASIEFCNYLEKLAKQKGSPELAQKAKQIMADYSAKFSAQNHIKRAEEAWESMDGLHEKVYSSLFKPEGGFFKNLKQFRSYLTADLIAERRNIVMGDLYKAKANISNNLTDVNEAIKQALNEVKISVDSQNTKAVDIVKNINNLINESKLLQGKTEKTAREAVFSKVKANLDDLLAIAKNDLQDKNDYNLAKKRIEKLTELLKPESYKKGLAQEAITDIKNMFPDGKNSVEYKQALKYMENMNAKLNNAIAQENNTYEKLAELAVGSAPSDVFGILWPTALGVGLVVGADNKEEKISKTLTQGLPILGGVGVTYYGTVRGFTGFKNLALGLGSGWVLNIIGTKIDELVKKYRGEQKKLKAAFDSMAKLQKTQNHNTTLGSTEKIS